MRGWHWVGLLLLGCGTDADGDGWLVEADCDDTNPRLGGPEIPYDGVNNDCDPSTLDDDLDQDGHRASEDCNDDDPSVGGDEIPYDGIDNDCDPATLDDDLDGDGRLLANDCDDTNPSLGGPEVPYDGVDNDCDPSTPDDDLDQDGFLAADDCDDLDDTVALHAALATELIDEIAGFCQGYCERGIVGDLRLTADGPAELGDDLACVTWVGGDVEILGTPLPDLAGLAALEAVEGTVRVEDNPLLSPTAVEAWVDGLNYIGGSVLVSGNGGAL